MAKLSPIRLSTFHRVILFLLLLLVIAVLAFLGRRLYYHIASREWRTAVALRGGHDVIFTDSAKCIPTVFVSTKGGYVIPLNHSEIWGGVRICSNGFGGVEDSLPMRIHLRGNGTSIFPKAPYTIKLESKQSLCGLRPAKSYVLLANATDRTLLHNALALELARLFEIPYTSCAVPVNLVLNGQYRGIYDLVDKINVDKHAIAIDKKTDVLVSLDAYKKDKYRFESTIYNLPVGIKKPDLDKQHKKYRGSKSPLQKVEDWKQIFARMEHAVADKDSIAVSEYVDLQSYVDYVIHLALTLDHDHLCPLSVYMYTTEQGKIWHFGPVWDYDLSFGNISGHNSERAPATSEFTADGKYRNSKGLVFFRSIAECFNYSEALKQRWAWFKENKLSLFWEAFDKQCELRRPYYKLNQEVWPVMGAPLVEQFDAPTDFEAEAAELRLWIEQRIAWIDHIIETEPQRLLE